MKNNKREYKKILLIFAFICIILTITQRVQAEVLSATSNLLTIDFTKVSTSPTAYNPDTTKTSTFGECVCDVTKGVCDYQCCCDSDCTTAQQEAFKLDGTTLTCKLPKYRLINTLKCVAKSEVTLSYVIPWNAGLKTEISDANNAFCVYYDHSPVVSNTQYYNAKTDLTQTQVDTEVKTVQQSSLRRKTLFATSYDATTTVQEPTTGYRASNKLKELFSADATTFSARGEFTIPSGVFSSLCDDTEAVTYLKPMKRECYRRITSLAASCAAELDINTYYVNKYISANAKVTTNNAGNANLPITLNSNSATGRATLATATSCTYAVSSVKYIVAVSTANLVTSVSAIVTTTNITAAAAPTTTAPLYLKQSFEVVFDSATTSVLTSTGEIIDRPGNPGYIPGAPILSGVAQSLSDNSKTAVQQRIDGFKLYSGSDCSNRETTSVGFDRDMVTSCRLRMTAAQLATFCQSATIPYISEVTDDRFGRFANADYLTSTDWLTLFTSSAPQASWDATSQICSSLGAIVQYNFVIAKAGSVMNEQWQIVGVTKSFVSQSWQFDTTKGATNDFYLQFRVSFTRSDQTSSQVLYNIPTLALTLPEDVFYPFSLVFGASSVSQPLSLAVLFNLVALALVVVLM